MIKKNSSDGIKKLSDEKEKEEETKCLKYTLFIMYFVK